MKKPAKVFSLGLAALGALVADVSIESPLGLGLVPDAAALIGRPWTPLSVAGVARRTTRRAVVYSSSVAASSAYAVAGAPTTVVVTAPPPAGGSVPIGNVVAALPAGCSDIVIGGAYYHKCGGAYYRAAFQGSNLVYVVSQP